MVLLTSSTVTVLLSSALVTTFTFLLFLSGYVLQQQTVASLREALHPPPLPTPTLPVYFSDVETNETDIVIGELPVVEQSLATKAEQESVFPEVVKGSSRQEVLQVVKDALPPGAEVKGEDSTVTQPDESKGSSAELPEDLPSVDGDSSDSVKKTEVSSGETSRSNRQRLYPIPAQSLNAIATSEVEQDVSVLSKSQPGSGVVEDSSLGYVLLVPTPPLVCSAIMFFSHLSYSQSSIPNRLILYPSFWEDSLSTDEYATGLALLKQAVHEHNVTVQSIHLSNDFDIKDLSSLEVEQAMLATIGSGDWAPHDYTISTLFYIRSPGLLLNAAKLDSVLTSFTTPSSFPALNEDPLKGWTRLPPTPVSTSILALPSDALHPSHLLISLGPLQDSSERHPAQVHLPSSDDTMSLVLNAMTSHNNHHVSEMEIEAQATGSAYVFFSEEEMRHRRRENQWYGGIFERFERGRREVCPGGLDQVLEGNMVEERRERGRARDRGRGW